MKINNYKIDLDEKFGKLNALLREKSNWILFLVFIGFVGYYVFLWYSYVYNAQWSESKKQEYIRTKEREVVFKKDQFDSVVSQVENRKINYEKNSEEVPDPFQLK